jgi:hypothetical protein
LRSKTPMMMMIIAERRHEEEDPMECSYCWQKNWMRRRRTWWVGPFAKRIPKWRESLLSLSLACSLLVCLLLLLHMQRPAISRMGSSWIVCSLCLCANGSSPFLLSLSLSPYSGSTGIFECVRNVWVDWPTSQLRGTYMCEEITR